MNRIRQYKHDFTYVLLGNNTSVRGLNRPLVTGMSHYSELDTSQIRTWRSIVTLVVFVITSEYFACDAICKSPG